MYSITQLQLLDYLQKRITNDSSSSFYEKNLKLVVCINNSYWYGDFVRLDRNYISQPYIDKDGEVEQKFFSLNGYNANKELTTVWNTYSNTQSTFLFNPFRRIKDLSLLFNALLEILEKSDINVNAKLAYPFLYNAQSLDGKSKLPFIHLTDDRLNLISIIEVEK